MKKNALKQNVERNSIKNKEAGTLLIQLFERE